MTWYRKCVSITFDSVLHVFMDLNMAIYYEPYWSNLDWAQSGYGHDDSLEVDDIQWPYEPQEEF